MANLAQYLFQRAQANPESIAIIDKTVKTNEPERPPQMALHGYGVAELRFSEFAARIKRLAGGLTALAQTSHGDRVVICMENRPEFFDLLFACWTAGLCPVPVNAKLHPKEVVHILRDCDARVAFLSGRLAPDIAAALADVHARRGRRRLVQEGRVGRAEVVVDDDVARAEEAERADGEVVDAPRARADEEHLSFPSWLHGHARVIRARGPVRRRARGFSETTASVPRWAARGHHRAVGNGRGEHAAHRASSCDAIDCC